LRALVADATLRRLDALLFTSQVQFRHVLAVARANGTADRLVDALATDVVVGAIGPVCAEALREGGIIPDVLPAQHHSAALIKAVADYFDLLRPPP
jgi:uroporphyrinogen-III synthase